MIDIVASTENLVVRQMRRPDFPGQEQLLRVPLTFVSEDNLVALVPDGSDLVLPSVELGTWPTRNVSELRDIVKYGATSTFYGGRKTPIDASSVRDFGKATIEGEGKPLRTLTVPMGARLLASSEDKKLATAMTSTGKRVGTEWFDAHEAIRAVSANRTRTHELSDWYIIGVLAKCLLTSTVR
jgi:hypothetical protein